MNSLPIEICKIICEFLFITITYTDNKNREQQITKTIKEYKKLDRMLTTMHKVNYRLILNNELMLSDVLHVNASDEWWTLNSYDIWFRGLRRYGQNGGGYMHITSADMHIESRLSDARLGPLRCHVTSKPNKYANLWLIFNAVDPWSAKEIREPSYKVDVHSVNIDFWS